MIIDLREIPVVWINLDSATKNAEDMQERLTKHGFKYTYRKSACVIDPPVGTPKEIAHYKGCGQSHIDILDDFVYPTPLLILEDDAEFTEHFNPIIEIPDDTDGVYLGVSHGNVYYKTAQLNSEYLKIGGILATHAILYISQKYRQIMSSAAKQFINQFNRPWDLGSASLQGHMNVYTPNNPFFYQANARESANKWEQITKHSLENRNSIFP
tara:strand:- start:1764 stop:2399 length:636 start_codon:yes stop_codon:yes gene_type:complete